MADSFVDIPLETDPELVEQSIYDRLAERFPGWVPAEGNLETHIARAAAFIWADLANLAVDVPAEVFNQFGEKILQVAVLDAASATGETTWTMVDDAGYTIPAGIQVDISSAGDSAVAFRTIAEVQVAPGDTVTGTGEVVIEAVLPGEAGNDLDATPTLIDALAFVSGVVLEDPTSGGVDAEDPVDYLDRLTAEAQLLSTRPILPADVETVARRIAGVHRALALDGYNPADETFNNERMLAVAVIDENGNALGAPVKALVDAELEGEREVNFVFNVIDPTYTAIDVAATVTVHSGYTAADVETACESAITDHLSPESHGKPPFVASSREWRNVASVYRNELIALLDRVDGVDRVVTVTLAEEGSALGTADVALDGPAPLPQPGTIAVTAS